MNDLTANAEIELDASGVGTVVVNGEDLTGDVDGLQLIVEAGKVPHKPSAPIQRAGEGRRDRGTCRPRHWD